MGSLNTLNSYFLGSNCKVMEVCTVTGRGARLPRDWKKVRPSVNARKKLVENVWSVASWRSWLGLWTRSWCAQLDGFQRTVMGLFVHTPKCSDEDVGEYYERRRRKVRALTGGWTWGLRTAQTVAKAAGKFSGGVCENLYSTRGDAWLRARRL